MLDMSLGMADIVRAILANDNIFFVELNKGVFSTYEGKNI